MATLTFYDKQTINDAFDLLGGYVFDLSNASFADFIKEEIGINIYNDIGYDVYESKANKLRRIFANENDATVAKLLSSLSKYAEIYYTKNQLLNEKKAQLIASVRDIACNLTTKDISYDLPVIQDITIEQLQEDIKSSLSRNAPELALDRLHTFSSKMLRKLCSDKGISIITLQGEPLPLHSLIGMLAKKYETEPSIKSKFSITAIKSSISLFEKFNDIRNSSSYSHDNDVLKKFESEYVVRVITATLTFIDNIEKLIKRNAEQEEINNKQTTTNFIDNLPY